MQRHWDTIQDIDFRSRVERGLYHKEGWAEPEWTTGHRFGIDLGPIPARAEYMLRFSAAPFQDQSFILRCNGVELGRHQAQRPFVVAYPIPRNAFETRPAISLEIEFLDPKRPCDYFETPDQRLVALSITRIEILGTDVPAGSHWPDKALLPDAVLSPQYLLSNFESLGDNCELGFVQKRSDIHSSTLLRFSATPIESLMTGLRHNFVGIDDRETMEIVSLDAPGSQEYQIKLHRYGLHYHTFRFTRQSGEEEVFENEREKLGHKHRKFLNTLSGGTRIFVVKRNDDLQAGEVWALWLLLQRYGNNTLLWVSPAPTAQHALQVSLLGPGLMRGYIPAFAPYTDATGGDTAAWLSICRQAYDIWSSGGAVEQYSAQNCAQTGILEPVDA